MTPKFKREIQNSFGQRAAEAASTLLDRFVGIVSPHAAAARMEARTRLQKLQLGYESARSSRERPNPPAISGPNSPLNQFDSIVLIRRAEELARDSAFMGKILDVYRNYVVGSLRYIPETSGGLRVNSKVEDVWDEWTTKADVTERFHFLDMLQNAHGGMMLQGDHGFEDFWSEDMQYQIQNVEGECIGNPRGLRISPTDIRGVVIDPETQKVLGYNIFRRTIYDTFHFDRFVPKPLFTHMNPVKRSDAYKAVTAFHAVLNCDFDVKEIINAEKMAVKWASKKIAVINQSNGVAPFMNTETFGAGGQFLPTVREYDGEVLYADPGGQINMVENNRPSENVMKFLEFLIHLAATGVDLPPAFVWMVLGLPGTYTRLISEQAKRSFQHGRYGQAWLTRTTLNPIKNKVLMAAVARGELEYREDLFRGTWMFPAHPTVDVGRESDANLAENRQGVLSRKEICAERGVSWRDNDANIREEAENMLRHAQNLADELNADPVFTKSPSFVPVTRVEAMTYMQLMTPNSPATMGTAPGADPPTQTES